MLTVSFKNSSSNFCPVVGERDLPGGPILEKSFAAVLEQCNYTLSK
jgi:hypothetical protein